MLLRNTDLSDPKIEVDRRRYPRVSLDIPVNFYLETSGDARCFKDQGHAVDVSPSGLLLKTRLNNYKKGQSIFLYPRKKYDTKDRGLRGKVKWVKQESDGCLNGIFIKDTQGLFLFFLHSISQEAFNKKFLDLMMDTFSDGAFLVDKNMRIISVSKKQPLVPIDREKAKGKKITDTPSVLKLFPSDQLNIKHDLQEVLYRQSNKQHSAMSLEFGEKGKKEKYAFNISYKYLNHIPLRDSVLIQIKDVTALYKLKENIKRRNKDLFEQYRFTLMGHIVDELLEDLISPLSAVVGRIDLLKMKMRKIGKSSHQAKLVQDWLGELETIDGLVDQITQHCTVAAKRREREKLGVLRSTVSINSLVQETIQILSVHEKFRKINIILDLKDGLAPLKGEYFDWLNAMIAVLQCLSRELQNQQEKEIKIETREEESHLVLSISHNAKALKIPLERESGLAIFEFIQKKYKTVIEAVGGNGKQKISFYINKDTKEEKYPSEVS